MHVIEVSGNRRLPVVVQVVEPFDFKRITKARFFFRWDKHGLNEELYKLTFYDNTTIMGLISLIDVPAEYRVEIKLLAVSKENMGRGKQYEGIAGCLIAYASRYALKKYGHMACVSLKPKTEIRQHYISRYNMKPGGLHIYLDGQALFDLVNFYSA